MRLRIGSLFSGYGGLEMGVQSVLGSGVAWHCENDPAASKVLAYHDPNVPNLGDITAVDWSQVEPVHALTGGFPCQPVSCAGKRAGISDARWLFDEIVRALSDLDPRPRLCVFENVPGLLTANRGDAMARVVRGLASVGYVGQWRIVRAADVGAPHGRARVFIVAWPTADAASTRQRWPQDARTGGDDAAGWPWRGQSQRGDCDVIANADESGRQGCQPTERHHMSPRCVVATGGTAPDWGRYALAITRWESVLGRVAPPPTQLGAKGQPRLSPAFVEWLMGLPAGWVTDVPEVKRNNQLKVLGNGVVPQQAAMALRMLLPMEAAA